MKSLLARLARLARRLAPPLLTAVVMVILWETAVRWFQWPAYFVPGPGHVAGVFLRQWPKLVQATALTAVGASGGYLLSLLAGIVIAFGFSQSRIIRRCLYPYAIFLQTVPIIAIAPLIINWLGTGLPSVVVVAFIISLFPIITNATAGMLAVDPELVDLFRLHNAGRLQSLWKLRLPNSVPAIITGAKISSGMAVIGAIVGEFFAGYGTQRYGLGYLILQTSAQLKTAELFAAVIASTLLGVTIFATVNGIGDAVLTRWYDVSERH